MLTFAQLSDLHLDGGPRALERARRVVGYLRPFADSLDAVLVTGDLADHGLAEEYKEVADVLDFPCPVMLTPGNHDKRETYREVLSGTAPSPDPINAVHDIGGVRFALCDSSIPGRDDGWLADETLAWLDSVLDDGPSFVCFHHPPVLLHTWVDGIRQFGARAAGRGGPAASGRTGGPVWTRAHGRREHVCGGAARGQPRRGVDVGDADGGSGAGTPTGVRTARPRRRRSPHHALPRGLISSAPRPWS